MTSDTLVDTPLSYDEALTVALVVLDIFCGPCFFALTAEQRIGAILLVDEILSAHVMPVLDEATDTRPVLLALRARLLELHTLADRARRTNARVH